jgi:hypothetical protein
MQDTIKNCLAGGRERIAPVQRMTCLEGDEKL